MLWISGSAFAFKSGKLYYKILSEEDRTVEVTFWVDGSYNINYVSGDIEIPQKVIYQSKTYTVTAIGNNAFSYCNLTSVTIPNSVTSIGWSAFEECSSLTSVTIPNSVTSIGSSAFSGCSSLISVTIPNSVTSIGSYAFSGCSLTSVSIPNSVTYIGGFAFGSELENINVDPENTVYSSIDGVLYNKDVTNLLYCPRHKTSVTIPTSVTSIGNYAFYKCSSLTSVSIPNSVTSIGNYAFYKCSSLTSVSIPNSVTSIGDKAFYECSSLTSVTIPNSVTSIGDDIFYNCSSLTSVTIPDSVTSIGRSAFYGCRSLTSVTIPNSVTSIGIFAFDGCSSLTSVTIPNSVTSIGDAAFQNCNLKTIYVQYEDPLKFGSIFSDKSYTEAVLYIPEGTIEAYKKVDPWRNFWTIEEIDPLIAKEIKFSTASIEISIGESSLLSAEVLPITTTDKTIAWSSSDENIVSITESGEITGVSVGKATITAKCGDVTATCEVEVLPVLAETVSLNKTTISLKINETYQLAATVSPDNTTDKTVTWTSSDDRIAKVSDTGLVTGISAGEAIVKASCGEISTECKVIVSGTTGIEEIATSPDSKFDVYNINGVMIKRACIVDDLHRLPKGIYIVVSGNKRYKIAI